MTRRRTVVLVGIGATFVLAHLGQLVSNWLPWAAPFGVAAVCGAVVAEANDGAGVGGLAAGGGGFLFVFSNFLNSLVIPVATGEISDGSLQEAVTFSVIQSVNTFALFGLAGMLAGGIAGFSAAAVGENEEPAAEASEGDDREDVTAERPQ